MISHPMDSEREKMESHQGEPGSTIRTEKQTFLFRGWMSDAGIISSGELAASGGKHFNLGGVYLNVTVGECECGWGLCLPNAHLNG